MTKEHNNPYHGNFAYEGRFRDFEKGRLLNFLKGQPDTEYWREGEFRGVDEWIPYNGRLYPRWAVRDYYELSDRQPGFISEDEVQDIPPRELLD